MTQRLLVTAAEHWYMFDGFAVAHGAGDLRELPLDRFCSYVRWYCTRALDEKQLAEFEAKLFMPPRGTIPTSGPWAPENETESLRAFQSAFG